MLCSSGTFKFQKWFLHVLHSHMDSSAAELKSNRNLEWSLQKSTEYIQCIPQKILELTVIYIITMMMFCHSGNSIHRSHECPWNTKLVCFMASVLVPIQTANNTEMLLKYCKMQCWNAGFSLSYSFKFRMISVCREQISTFFASFALQ